jgi:hypothetical protein
MEQLNDSLKDIQEIKSMMQRSSRFISLSGWSGISAGICACVGAYFANKRIDRYYAEEYKTVNSSPSELFLSLVLIASVVFISALVSAFIFTYQKSKQDNTPIWGTSAKRLLWNTLLPMLVGGLFILEYIRQDHHQYVAATCLIFYGLGLVNGSKYTLGEIRYLGYVELALGILCLFFTRHGLLYWTLGFGVAHISYGLAMWWKYDRPKNELA